MNVKRLKQEVEEYLSRQTLCSCDSVSYCNIKNLVVGFAESKEERILELEKENVELTNELTKMTNVASFQQSANMNRWAEIKELKKRLSESRKVLKQILSDYKDMGSISKELIEWANDIVRGK